LGLREDDLRCQKLQEVINNILQICVGVDDMKKSGYYKELLKNIIYNDACFNMGFKTPAISGECNIDVIIDKHLEENNDTVIAIKNVTKFLISNVIVGV
jgi:hypothetical protein